MPSLKTWEWMALAGVALLILWYFRRKQPVNQVRSDASAASSAVPIVADPSMGAGPSTPPVEVLLGQPSSTPPLFVVPLPPPPTLSPISLAPAPLISAVAAIVPGQGNNPNDPNDNWNIRIT
jgi:hypothetical protein